MKEVRPLPLNEATSYKLSQVKRRDTSIEINIRALLHKQGYRYRVRNSDLPGSPDIANRKNRWAIFVHGCYWHHHDNCSKATIPKNNKEFWVNKFQNNRLRDKTAVKNLQDKGYSVLTIWECEIKKEKYIEKKLINFIKKV